MSVLIKGMEMPKSCGDCKVFVCYRQWAGDVGDCFCGITKNDANAKEKNADCPIVPVPQHGRLIDERWLKDAMITTLEALKKNPKMDRQEMHLIAAFDTLRCMVEDAPTIIEAEEGE